MTWPVLKFLPFFRWWKEIILQDGPLKLRFEPNTVFFRKHKLFRDPSFKRFFDAVLAPVVLAAHDEGERLSEEQRGYDAVKAQQAMQRDLQSIRLDFQAEMVRLAEVQRAEMQSQRTDLVAAVAAAMAGAGSKRCLQVSSVAAAAVEVIQAESSPEPAAKRHQPEVCLPKAQGYACPHKVRVAWPASLDQIREGAARLDANWAYFDAKVRPYFGSDQELDQTLAIWDVSPTAAQHYNSNHFGRDKPVMFEVAERGDGSKEKEPAMLKVLKIVMHTEKVNHEMP